MTDRQYDNPEMQAQPAFLSALDRFIREGLTLPSFGRVTPMRQQLLPVNVYQTDEDVVVVAPMPGLRTEDIEVTVAEGMLTIHGEHRGPEQETKHYVRHEWDYGPYRRTVSLPAAVNADKANATFSNGLLVVSLPKWESTKPNRIVLQHVGQNQGERAGHSAAEFMPGGHHHQKAPGTD